PPICLAAAPMTKKFSQLKTN
ncbi:unnamed protein product, partial [Allacma fusca]